jgi:ankyrin repeat protein
LTGEKPECFKLLECFESLELHHNKLKHVSNQLVNYRSYPRDKDVEKQKSGELKTLFNKAVLLMCYRSNSKFVTEDIFRIAAAYGYLPVVKFILSSGVSIHTMDDAAIRWSAENGHLSTVKLLVEQGANIHAQDDYAIRWAETKGHKDVVDYLKKKIIEEQLGAP